MPTPRRRRADQVGPVLSHDNGVTVSTPERDQVERRAFELYCARGRRHGHDMDDWLSAERELKALARVGAPA